MIVLQNVFKIYIMGDNEVRALDDVSFTIDEGEFVALIGQSGSGKSTCMNIIGALDIPTGGTYYLQGQDVGTLQDDELATIRNKMIGFVFQQYNLIAKLNVYENVELPLIYSNMHQKVREEYVFDALKKVGLQDRAKHMPSQLSGGQQQRVSIARALVTKPSVILADEPTGALDSQTGREIIEFLQQLNREGKTIVLVTHDKAIASEAKRIITIHDGKILSDVVAKKEVREYEIQSGIQACV